MIGCCGPHGVISGMWLAFTLIWLWPTVSCTCWSGLRRYQDYIPTLLDLHTEDIRIIFLTCWKDILTRPSHRRYEDYNPYTLRGYQDYIPYTLRGYQDYIPYTLRGYQDYITRPSCSKKEYLPRTSLSCWRRILDCVWDQDSYGGLWWLEREGS